MKPQVVIVGAGAAGLMAAIWAGRGGAQPLVLEGGEKAGAKILISGGGRCNLLPNEGADPPESAFHSSGSRNILKRWFKTWRLPQLQDFFRWELGIELSEEDDDKLFPASGKAVEVRDALLQEAEAVGASFRFGWRVQKIEKIDGDGFRLESESGETIECQRLILATGGESVPQTGSDGTGLRLAKSLGHSIVPTYPALVPLTSSDDELTALSGISLPARWSAQKDGRTLAEGMRSMLITHKGFSGPAILDASHHVVRDGADLTVAWEGYSRQEWVDYLQSRARRSVSKTVADLLPNRLAALLVERSGVRGEMRCGNLTRGTFDALLEQLCDFPLQVSGHRGFAVAEVTGGGIPIDQVQPSTLESRRAPGLFLCGEMLDVFGDIGGYNFQFAFLSGRLAGESAAVG